MNAERCLTTTRRSRIVARGTPTDCAHKQKCEARPNKPPKLLDELRTARTVGVWVRTNAANASFKEMPGAGCPRS